MTSLRVEDLTVTYRSGDYDVRPLDGFTMQALDGEMVLLLGPSGCGKTTLLSCLAGILTPSDGSIRVAGTELVGLSGADLTAYRRRTVGVVFQAFNLVPSLTALENVMTPLLATGTKRAVARLRAAELLDEVDLAARAGHRPGQLSGGQQQRVAIARALAHDPPLLLADEPTAHLDYLQVEGVLALLRRLATAGRVVVVATHDDRMLPLGDRVVDLAAATADGAARQQVELAAGEVLFRQGERGRLVYVVTDGEVELLRERADGKEERLALCKPGDYFGELAPLLGFPRAATARARRNTTLTAYDVAEFRTLVGADGVATLLGRRRGTRRPTVPSP
ncbi:MAG: ATP-binding cassette domain-containing protein [Mycobacteriales bacterium]|nr:ATP-binding cassette domain-containing protein [Mycobacteriales bacterium]